MKLTVAQLKKLISESFVSEAEASEPAPLLVCSAIEADQSMTLSFPSGDEELFDRCARVWLSTLKKYGVTKAQGDTIVVSRVDPENLEDLVNHVETTFTRLAGVPTSLGPAPEGADFGFTMTTERKRDVSPDQAHAEEIIQATIDSTRIKRGGWAPVPASADLHGLVGQFSMTAPDGSAYDLYIDEPGDAYVKRF